MALHQFRHELSQEDRAATYVGAAISTKGKIVAVVDKVDCSTVTRVDIDESTLMLYARNDCHGRARYTEWHWEEISPDGTVVKGNFENWKCPYLTTPKVQVECVLHIPMDDRTSYIRVWTKVDIEGQ